VTKCFCLKLTYFIGENLIEGCVFSEIQYYVLPSVKFEFQIRDKTCRLADIVLMLLCSLKTKKIESATLVDVIGSDL